MGGGWGWVVGKVATIRNVVVAKDATRQPLQHVNSMWRG